MAEGLTKAQAAVLATFASDSFALGYHWVYNVNDIPKGVSGLVGPHAQYHPNRKAGEFTPYGDQMVVLLESIHAKKEFDLADYSARWQSLFASYTGYVDGATKNTLANYTAQKPLSEVGSQSHDLSVAGRIAPLLLLYERDRDLSKFVDNAVAYASATHNSPGALSATEIIARTTAATFDGKTPTEALNIALETTVRREAVDLTKSGLETVKNDTLETIAKIGASCDLKFGLPAVAHLVSKYEDDLTLALQKNLEAGGQIAS